MLADKMKRHGATAWLVNTGWSGGRYMRDSTWSLLKNLVKEVPGCLLVILLHPVTLSVVKCYMHKVITSDSVAVFHTEVMVSGRE
jgi:CO dehydrogenase/acetyl-CoA synthase delta subunit